MVVVLPSPAGVGLIAVTRMSFPSGRFERAAKKIIFELGDEAAERAQGGFGRADLRGDLGDRLQARSARDFDVRPP